MKMIEKHRRLLFSIFKSSLPLGLILSLLTILHTGLAAESINIHGYVRDISGKSLNAYICINDQDGVFVTGTSTDSSGYYRIIVPRHSSYNIWVDAWVKNGDYWVDACMPQNKEVTVQPGQDTLLVNFSLQGVLLFDSTTTMAIY
ncbi:MAG: hypothetical protein DRP09_14595 [Candidatus Thorarchaeota archaeon]|nr:MAG: hypothetical protein DRP09_14595 [Candidatus Thorarchaeota archaeon]